MIKNNQLYGFPYLELTGFHDHESGVLDKRTEDRLKKYIKEEAIPHLDKLIISYTEKANAIRDEISKCTDEGYKLLTEFFIDKEKNRIEQFFVQYKASLFKYETDLKRNIRFSTNFNSSYDSFYFINQTSWSRYTNFIYIVL